jgi:hypothetical protein
VGESVKAFHQIVVELYEDLSTRHHHMVNHMISCCCRQEARCAHAPACCPLRLIVSPRDSH